MGRKGKQKSDAENEFNARLGSALEKVRKQSRVKASTLCRAVDISRQQLYCFECGSIRIPPFTLAEICRVLGVSVGAVMKMSGKSIQFRNAPCAGHERL
jgi:transcriptional regulator with XRE-family HTH domain